ncbi:LOW QUALITY PROTEIN: hypothetical protein V2J09_016971 [Rumex salicifolius]
MNFPLLPSVDNPNPASQAEPLGKPPDPPLSWSERVSGNRKKTHAPLDRDALWKEGKRSPIRTEWMLSLMFPLTLMRSLYAAWSNSVVLKVLGRGVSYPVMERRVRQLWNLKGQMTLMDLPNHYFVARFELEEDFLHVLTEGPWMIFGNYIVVRQWDPLFRPESDVIHTTYAWVRLSGLSMVMYEESVLYGIAAAIGNPIRIDLNTLTAARGKFARVCIEIDITQPLLGSIMVEGEKVYLEYEGLYTVCFRCGRYGHLVAACSQPAPTEVTTTSEPDVVPSSAAVGVAINSNLRDIGPHMVVPWNNRRRSSHPKKLETAENVSSKNRFSSLAMEKEDTEDLQAPPIPAPVKETVEKKLTLPPVGHAKGPAIKVNVGGSELHVQGQKGKNKKNTSNLGKRAKADGALDKSMGHIVVYAAEKGSSSANKADMQLADTVSLRFDMEVDMESSEMSTHHDSMMADVKKMTDPPDPNKDLERRKYIDLDDPSNGLHAMQTDEQMLGVHTHGNH